ncbi:Protein of unknown function DUF928 [Trichormus variabilis ATCC 29413]|uniref:DUF928 domain-containing protein n=2 Tax=Anabaena variabilis TaxID=264691 RepID=Q3M5F2_TRIV2|nr:MULTISPECIES: DUF928 domain-containing protein [Nostocaceae]ABA23784.1 Protein of unknown function DUF928 [Trichormus variabilis ATCC 29413]MBC1213937.1 DUF928 domain-containing protein [Trichormus variabilis ARAD]MBC1255982.1 DUF928 domain-containing protein [Trichormus variabilis V5]MBC1265884.1 DUF928 domain-containing protein [Trichormus variabilis FSR]MBC1300331.1 DUF928 domain-containing protein [Trichormus variabilis N2B]
MIRQQLSHRQQKIFLCILTTVFYLSFLSPVFLQPAQAQNVFERIGRLFSNSRPEGNASGRSRGGATRSQCSQIDKNTLIALVPQSNEGLTTQDHPQFLFYLPFGGSSQSPPAKFRLLNEQKKSVLTKPLPFSLPETKGIVSITLPATEKPLLIGQRYHWYLNITCVNEQGLNTNISVDGWIKRVEAASQRVVPIKHIGYQSQYIPYAENNIWYETVSKIATNRATHQQEWSSLLALFELEEFATSPIYELKLQQPSTL